MALWVFLKNRRQRWRHRGGRERGDGAGGHQLPVAHRQRLQEEVREEDLHTPAEPRRQEGAHQPQVRESAFYPEVHIYLCEVACHSLWQIE